MDKAFFEEKPGMFGIVDDEYLYYTEGSNYYKARYPGYIERAGQLIQMAIDKELLSLWIVSDSSLSRRATHEFLMNSSEEYDLLYNDEKGDRLISFQGYPRSVNWQPTRYVGYCDRLAWDFDNQNPRDIGHALFHVEKKLNIAMKPYPGTVGMDLIKKSLAKNPEWIKPTVNGRWQYPLTSDLRWARKLTREELDYKYVHAIDKNSMYLSSCRGLMLPAGQPTHYKSPRFVVKKPGVWKLTGITGLYSDLLPKPIYGDGWYWTPTVNFLRAQKFEFEIEEAVVWEESHQTLDTFANDLWAARRDLKNQDHLAYLQIKDIATATIGRLAHWPEHTSRNTLDYYHPGWYSMIVDQSRARMHWRIKTLHDTGYSPFMCYTDSICFLSNKRDMHDDIPALLENEAHLGGYKPHYTVELAKVIDAIQAEPGVDKLDALFKQHNIMEL